MGCATRPWARAGAARKVKLKPLSVCSKCAFVFEQMTQPACMTCRHALLLNIVITLPGSGNNFRSWKHTQQSIQVFVSFLFVLLWVQLLYWTHSWWTVMAYDRENSNMCLNLTGKALPLAQILFLPTSGGSTCFRNFPALLWVEFSR